MKQSKNNTVITMAHIRAAGGCAPGARAWFRQYGIDFKRFIQDGGIDARTVLNTGDAFAARVVEIAEEEAKQGGSHG